MILLLMDGDNAWINAGRLDLRGLQPMDTHAQHVVVSLAISTATLLHPQGPGPGQVETFANDLALGLFPNATIELEIAVVLDMPEAADEALRKLACSDPLRTRTFRRAYLVTADLGLAASLGMIPRRYRPLRVWRAQCPITRSSPAPAVAAGSAPVHLPRRSFAARNTAQASFLGSQTTQAPIGSSLYDLAQAFETAPWIASQVSVTTTCTRGVDRLGQLLSGVGSPLSSSPNDGVVFEVDPTLNLPAVAFASDKPTPVGPGTAWVFWQDGTLPVQHLVRTRLPRWLLGRRCPVRRWARNTQGELHDRQIVNSLGAGIHPGERACVRLRRGSSVNSGPFLEAKEISSANAWWWQNQKARKRLKVNSRWAQEVLPNDVEDIVAVTWQLAGQLVLGCVDKFADDVVADVDIPQGAIGPARRGKTQCALWAAMGSVARGDVRRTEAIQLLGKSDVSARLQGLFPKLDRGSASELATWMLACPIFVDRGPE